MTRDEALKLIGLECDRPPRLVHAAVYIWLTERIPGGEPALLALLADEAVVVPKEPTEARS